LVSARNPVHWQRNANKEPERLEGERLRQYIATRRKGAGLGLPFATEMVRRTGVPIGLLACAHGGTSMDQWNPDLLPKAGESLYGSMMMRIRDAGGKVTGILWYQGESDANPGAAPAFQQKFESFIASVRRDIGDPNLPFYYVQIGRNVSAANEAVWNFVQEGQRKAEAVVPRTGMVAAVDTALDDGIHVSTPDLKRVGHRLANLACHDLFPAIASCVGYKRGPRPVSATFSNGLVRVAFSEVNGRLVSRGRIAGFTIHNAEGAPVPLIYKAQVDPGNPSQVLLSIGGKLPEGAQLRYGFGRDPYVNLLDQADMAVPVFGPIPIQSIPVSNER
jgi:sialate O-acetylesterase